MTWITTTAKSLPEAIDLALDNLGVDESEAEIVVVEEPKQGFFGRAKGIAKVEARVKPKQVRNKQDRKRRQNNRPSNKNSGSKPQKGAKSNAPKPASPRKNPKQRQDKPAADRPAPDTPIEEVSDFLKQYMVGLSEAFGIDDNVAVKGDAEAGLTVSLEGQHGLLVGQKGRTLNAIQELVRVSTQRSKPSEYRIYVDVGGYREKRREALSKFALDAAEKAKAEGIEVVLDPMPSADRKVIHDALNDDPEVETRSAGVEPRRKVVVVPVENN